MRNRAKCRKCCDIIESFHENDYIECRCKEISITGGNIKYICAAKDWSNFLRVDDQDKEISVMVEKPKEEESKASKKDLLDSLKHLMQDIDRLPDHALQQPVNYYDFYRLASLVWAIFESEDGFLSK